MARARALQTYRIQMVNNFQPPIPTLTEGVNSKIKATNADALGLRHLNHDSSRLLLLRTKLNIHI